MTDVGVDFFAEWGGGGYSRGCCCVVGFSV